MSSVASTREVIRRSASLRVLVAVSVAVALSFVAARPASADAPAPAPSTAQYEIDYMKFTIDHHAMGIRMGELCVQKATDAQLRDLCSRIIAQQSQELQQLQAWLRDWYGISYEPQMTPADMQMLQRLASLSGAEFDIEISRMFIQHHAQIIARSLEAIVRVYHPELRALARGIVATQSREIGEFTAIIVRASVRSAVPNGRPGGA